MFIQSAMTRGGPGQEGGSSNGLVMDDVTAIQEQVNGVAGVSVDQATSGTIKYDNTSLEEISIVGTTADFLTVRDLNLGDGRFLTDQDNDRTSKVVVLGSTVAEELFG